MNDNHRDNAEDPNVGRIGNPSHEESRDDLLGRVGDPSYDEVREARLTAYALGQLGPDEHSAVEDELAASPAARRVVEESRAAAEKLREVSRATLVLPSTELRAAVESRLSRPPVQWLARRSGDLDATLAQAPARLPRYWRSWAALATAVCFLGAAVGLYLGHRDRAAETGPGALALEDHVVPPRQPPDVVPPPVEKAPVESVADEAKRAATTETPTDGGVSSGGWRPHVAAIEPSAKAPAKPSMPEPSPRVAVDESGPSPTKLDSREIGSPDAPAKADKLAAARRPPARSASRGARHQPATNPGFLGPGAPADRAYATVSPEVPAPPPPKQPKTKGDGASIGPKPFGADVVASKSLDADGPEPTTKAGGSKKSRPDEAHLAMPPGMRSDRAKPTVASKAGKGSSKTSKKGKATEPAVPAVDVFDEPPSDLLVENEFLPAVRFPYSAFSLEVDRSTYGDLDRWLRAGQWPPAHRVQVEDLVNYFAYDDMQPAGDAPFAIGIEGAACPWAGDHRLVRVAVVGRDAPATVADRAKSARPATAQPIARDVRVQLEFNPALVASYRLIGYDGPTAAAEKPQGALRTGLSFPAGETVTALYEIVPAKAAPLPAADVRPPKPQRPPVRDVTARAASNTSLAVRLRYQRPRSEEYRLMEAAWSDAGRSFEAASSDFRFAAAVAAFGMALRESPYRGDITLETIERIARSARGDDLLRQRDEFANLVALARKLAPNR